MSSSRNHISDSQHLSTQVLTSKRKRTEDFERRAGDDRCDNSHEPISKRQCLDRKSQITRNKIMEAGSNKKIVSLYRHCDDETFVVFHTTHCDENQTASSMVNAVNVGGNSSRVTEEREPLSENVQVNRIPEVYSAEDFQTPVGQRATRHRPGGGKRVVRNSDDLFGAHVVNDASRVVIKGRRRISSDKQRSASSTSLSQDEGEYDEDVAFPTETLDFYQGVKPLTFDFMNLADLHTRWPNSGEMWKAMEERDQKYPRPENVLQNHPRLTPYLRSDVLVKMAMLCEKMTCSRETFHLAVDYLDRYLSLTDGRKPCQFIIIALACLLLAIRMEYKKKESATYLYRFARKYRCEKRDLMRQKMDVIHVLKWKLCPVTTNTWLCSYLQNGGMDKNTPEPENVWSHDVKHDRMTSFFISRITDLSLMDVKSTKFPYKVMAASALYFHSNREFVTSVSDLTWSELSPCIEWMHPFFKAIMDRGDLTVKWPPGVKGQDVFEIQSSFINMPLFCRGLALRSKSAKQTTMSSTSDELHPILDCTLSHPCQVKFPSGTELWTSDCQSPFQDLMTWSAQERSESICSDICDDKNDKEGGEEEEEKEEEDEEDDIILVAAKEDDTSYTHNKNQEQANVCYESKVPLHREISYIEISDDEDFDFHEVENSTRKEQQDLSDVIVISDSDSSP